MSNEMTQVDIDQLKAELAERQARVPALRDEVKRTKEYGDLSENAEYRCAKREYNRNKSRMRYLERTIENAVVIRVQRQLLGHEAERGVMYAVDLLDGVLHFRRAVGTVQIRQCQALFHNLITSSFYFSGSAGRSGLEYGLIPGRGPVPGQ